MTQQQPHWERRCRAWCLASALAHPFCPKLLQQRSVLFMQGPMVQVNCDMFIQAMTFSLHTSCVPVRERKVGLS